MSASRNDIPIGPTLEALGIDTSEGPGSKVLCVFHGERRPSAVYYEFYFICFACGVKGDAARMLHDFEGLDWKGAYQRAKELAGVEDGAVPEQRSSSRGVSGRPRVHSGHHRFGETGSG